MMEGTKGDVVKRSGCILVYGNTTKGGVVERSVYYVVYGHTTKSDVVKRSNCILYLLICSQVIAFSFFLF